MVTRNFLNLLAMTLQDGSNRGGLLARAVNGECRYLMADGGQVFPYNPTKAVTLDAWAAGISVGTGNTAPTDENWNLESHISSGISLLLSETAYGVDGPGIPWVQYKITVTNTGSDPITVKEIGYKQTCASTPYPNYNVDAATKVFLLDRTVLDTPVTIAAGDAGIVTYKLRTIPRPYETVGGVQIVDFAYGTDEQIAAILDAAIAGDIDLQRDAGWRVGDKRVIHLDAFTGGNSVANAAEDVCIVISSFDEYMGCGNILQFDFVTCTTAQFRMNATATTAGGYGATEMYTTTLPALVEALPSWLRTRLKTFSVLAGAGMGSSTIETVTGNKLALRSEVEVYGGTTHSQAGEGALIPYYFMDNRGKIKRRSLTTASTDWWERSPTGNQNYCTCSQTLGNAGSYAANNAKGLAPFGCI